MRVVGMLGIYALACGGSSTAPGMVGVVGNGIELDEVELFVGNAAVTDAGCSGSDASVSPEGLGCFSGKGWTNGATSSTFEAASGGTTWFQLAPDGSAVPALLAVGYSGGSAVAAAVVHDLAPGAQPIEIVLAKFQPFATSASNQQPSGLAIWRRPADTGKTQPACALFAHADGALEFFVPADDTDCDSATMECKRGGFDYCFSELPVNRSDFSCFEGDATGCHIGGVGCADVGPACPVPAGGPITTTGCAALTNFDACVPAQFCTGGADPTNQQQVPPCDQWDPSCFTSDHYASVVHVVCTIPVAVDPVNAGQLVSCNATEPQLTQLVASSSAALLDTNACGDIDLSVLDGTLNQANQLEITQTSGGSGEIDVQLQDIGGGSGSGSGSCVKQIQFSGQNFGLVFPDSAITADAALEIATINEQHRFVPIHFAFVGCGSGNVASSACTVVGDPTNPLKCPEH